MTNRFNKCEGCGKDFRLKWTSETVEKIQLAHTRKKCLDCAPLHFKSLEIHECKVCHKSFKLKAREQERRLKFNKDVDVCTKCDPIRCNALEKTKKCANCNEDFHILPIINGKTVNLYGSELCLNCKPLVYIRKTRVCDICNDPFLIMTRIEGKVHNLRHRSTCLNCLPLKDNQPIIKMCSKCGKNFKRTTIVNSKRITRLKDVCVECQPPVQYDKPTTYP